MDTILNIRKSEFLLTIILLIPLKSLAFSWDPLGDLNREISNCFSGGCDVIWGINQRLDQGIESKSASLGNGVRNEVQIAADYIFDMKLEPFAKSLQQLVDANFITAEHAAHNLLEHSDKIIENIFSHTDNTLDTIRNKIIESTFKQADTFQTKFFNNIN